MNLFTTEIVCCQCRRAFFLYTNDHDALQRCHNSFWCPHCGTTQYFTGKDVNKEAQELKMQLQAESNAKDMYRDEAQKQKGIAKSLRRQIKMLKGK